MPPKDILLQLNSDPEPTPDMAIDAAISFAAAVGGCLTALAVQVDLRLASHPLADRLIDLIGLEKEWEGRSLANCQAALQYFETGAKNAGVFAGAEVRKINLYDAEGVVARYARTRDLCIIPFGSRYDGQIELAQQVIFQSGRPVLAFSAQRPILANGSLQDVVVAWDGSRSATRALAGALPLLKRAASVRVVTFVNEKEAAEAGLGADVVRHLSVHGIKAVADEVDARDVRVGEAIDAYLARFPADLLVMGAYGRSRMLEFVLGGATEHVLRAPPTSLYMAH